MRRLVLCACLFVTWFAPAGPATGQPRETPTSFARFSFHHGLPYAAAHALGPQAVPELLAMLERPEERAHWANVIRILGMIGEPRATPVLIDFVERRFAGEVGSDEFRALIEVNQSLGLLAHDPSSRAFAYMTQSASLQAWRAKKLKWTFPSLSGDKREMLMLKLTINGLGHAGNDAARNRLADLEKELRADANLWRYVRDNLDDARRLNDRIRKEGYERVFR